MSYGYQARSDWGSGDTLCAWRVGDVVWIPERCAAITDDRVDRPGLHRIISVFSISEEPWFYYRVSPVVVTGEYGNRLRVDRDVVSDRIHVYEDTDYTAGWSLVHAAVGAADAALVQKEPND